MAIESYISSRLTLSVSRHSSHSHSSLTHTHITPPTFTQIVSQAAISAVSLVTRMSSVFRSNPTRSGESLSPTAPTATTPIDTPAAFNSPSSTSQATFETATTLTEQPIVQPPQQHGHPSTSTTTVQPTVRSSLAITRVAVLLMHRHRDPPTCPPARPPACTLADPQHSALGTLHLAPSPRVASARACVAVWVVR